jgi:alanyl-tRNA synthetase
VDALQQGERGLVIVNQTPFYAESGGQQPDMGLIVGENGGAIIDDVQKRADGLFVHFGRIENGTLSVGDAVRMSVDSARRTAIRANHSATHLLHAALRNVLGSHVAQKGSLVAPDRLRFDFSHPKPVDAHEIEAVEDLANTVLLQDAPVTTRLMDREEAMTSGAMALFGEKYGEEVRVVSMGTMPGGVPGKAYSVELCGGTHVNRTGEIGLIALISEAGVASGVRGMVAVSGNGERTHLGGLENRLRAGAQERKVRPDEAAERAATLVEERRKLERELADARRKLAMGGGGDGAVDGGVKTVGAVKFLGRTVSGIAPKDLKGLVDDGKKAVGSGVVAMVAVSEDGKGAIVVGVTADLVARLNAVDLVRAGAEALGGKGGGGRPDMAQAGGPDGGKADAALGAIEAAIAAAP